MSSEAIASSTVPAVTAVTFDKPVYVQGDIITATVAYTGASSVLNLTGNLLGFALSGSATFTILPTWNPPGDTGKPARVWTLVSDDGQKAVFSAVA